MRRPRIALIGLGMAVTPHARSLLDLADRVEVAYAFSPSAARRKSFAARFPFPLADSLDTILDDATVDAVLILTPPNTHLDLTRLAARAGKHVLLEKPLEINTERAAALVEACRAAGVTLAMVLQHRFRPAVRTLRAGIEDAAFGRIVSASASIRLWRPQSYYDEPGRGTLSRDGGGVLLTQAIHTLDLLLWLAGAVETVSAFVTTTPLHRMETEDLVCAAIRFRNGALGAIHATTAAFPGFPERIEISGEGGSATLSGDAVSILWSDGRKHETRGDGAPTGAGASPMDFPHDYHRDLIVDFLRAIESSGAPAVTGEAALNVHRLIDALTASRNGAPTRVAHGD